MNDEYVEVALIASNDNTYKLSESDCKTCDICKIKAYYRPDEYQCVFCAGVDCLI